ncbi:MAG: hypothetical protein NVSMB6_02050 [Burkholderiaceae bacterium]
MSEFALNPTPHFGELGGIVLSERTLALRGELLTMHCVSKVGSRLLSVHSMDE